MRRRMSPKTVLVTGASSGIGRSLAIEYASRGARVALVARRRDALDEVTRTIRGRGGVAVPIVADMADTAANEAAVKHAHDELHSLEMVIANAGMGSVGHASRLTVADVSRVIDLNVRGAFVTLVAAIPFLLAQKRGHLVGVSSLAGRRGLPRTGAYSASKAALSTFLQTLRMDLAPRGIDVTDIQPGFVDTALSAGAKNRPFLWSAEKAARRIAEQLERAPAVYAFPLPVSALVSLSGALPDAWVSWVARRNHSR